LTNFNEFQRNEKRFAIELTHLATAGLPRLIPTIRQTPS
jgi:hypothetical protein